MDSLYEPVIQAARDAVHGKLKGVVPLLFIICIALCILVISKTSAVPTTHLPGPLLITRDNFVTINGTAYLPVQLV